MPAVAKKRPDRFEDICSNTAKIEKYLKKNINQNPIQTLCRIFYDPDLKF